MAGRYNTPCLLQVVLVITAFVLTLGFSFSLPGELHSKKLLSFPTLVSMLKAKNSTRPLSAPMSAPVPAPVLAPVPAPLQAVEKAQQQVPLPLMAPPTAFMTPPVPASVATALSLFPVVSSSKHDSICPPVSKEKNVKIAKLCDTSGRKGANVVGEDGSNVSRDSCLRNFCVAIIPGDEGSDSIQDDLDGALDGVEIVAYTECEAVKNLFKVLEKSDVTPKCFDCGA